MVLFCDTFTNPDSKDEDDAELEGSVYLDGSFILEDGTVIFLDDKEIQLFYLEYLERRIEEIIETIPKQDPSYLSPHQRINLFWLLLEKSSVTKNGLKEYNDKDKQS